MPKKPKAAKRPKWLMTTMLMSLTPGLAVMVFLLLDIVQQPRHGVFKEAGFLVLRPTTDHHTLGHFSTVEERTGESVTLHPTCRIDEESLAAEIIKTRTVDQAIDRALSLGSVVSPKNWDRLGLSLDFQRVEKIRSTFTNSSIWFLPAQVVYAIRERYLRDDCQEAIIRELEKGFEVCQSKSVVVSDLVYEIGYESGVSAGAESAASETMSIDAAHEVDASKTQRVQGYKMFHAVKLDEACFLLNDQA